MTRSRAGKLFGFVYFWTVVTGIFTWLPLVRIAGKPEGYTWGVLGLSGAGTEGRFWIFGILVAWVVATLFTLQRGPGRLARVLALAWHVAVTGVVVAAVATGGVGATWEGQGLGWSVPMWILVVPFTAFTALTALWVATDRRSGAPRTVPPWSRANTRRLIASLALLGIALALFRAGTNYDAVTAAAIVTTILHWILLAESFAPRPAITQDA